MAALASMQNGAYVYRRLLESGRKRPGIPRRHPEALHRRATELRDQGRTYELVAEAQREEFPNEAGDLTRHAAALVPRGPPKVYIEELMPGLSARTVRYIHTILHAALKDALRWNRVVPNVADAATPPSMSSAKSPRTKAWTAEQLKAFLQFIAENRYLPTWIFLLNRRESSRSSFETNGCSCNCLATERGARDAVA